MPPAPLGPEFEFACLRLFQGEEEIAIRREARGGAGEYRRQVAEIDQGIRRQIRS